MPWCIIPPRIFFCLFGLLGFFSPILGNYQEFFGNFLKKIGNPKGNSIESPFRLKKKSFFIKKNSAGGGQVFMFEYAKQELFVA
jgi:hypothetical protein